MIPNLLNLFQRCWWFYLVVGFVLFKSIDVVSAKTNRVNFLMQGEVDVNLFANKMTPASTSAFKMAIEYYEIWSRYAPHDGLIQGNLAFCYYQLKDRNRAISLLKRAVQLEPAMNIFHWDLAWIYFKNNQIKEATLEWEQFLTKYPVTLKYFADVRARMLERNEQMGLNLLAKILARLDEDRTEAYIRLAECYYQAQQFQLVNQITKEGLQSYPNNRWLYYMSGLAEYNLGHWFEAATMFKESIRVYPVDINAFYYHALCMRQLKLRNDEEQDLNRIKELKERGIEPLVMPKADVNLHFNTELLTIRYRLKVHSKF